MARKEFSADVKRQVFTRSEGRCELHRLPWDLKAELGETCDRVGKEFDHVTADCLGGEPTAENCAFLCATCHKAKTKTDVGYKAKRRRHTVDKERAAKRKANPSPKIRTRGFNKSLKRKFNGEVVPRND